MQFFNRSFKENGFEQGFDQIYYQDSGLHVYPKKLKEATQAQIDEVSEPSLIILGYGLCGNGMHGIQAGPHTLLIPRVDDCIAMLMGSRGRYLAEKQKNAGTYFMTRGWLDSDANPLAEYKKTVARLGEEKAAFVMDIQYKNYSRLMFVAHEEKRLKGLPIKNSTRRGVLLTLGYEIRGIFRGSGVYPQVDHQCRPD